MLLLTFASLQFYGPAAGAMVAAQPGVASDLPLKGTARVNLQNQIVLPTEFLKPTRLVNSPMQVQGVGELHQATPKGTAKAVLTVSIGAVPSAYDIAQAVWLQNMAQVNVAGTTGNKLFNASADPQAIADAVLDENLDDHQSAGSVGKKIKEGLKTSEFIALK